MSLFARKSEQRSASDGFVPFDRGPSLSPGDGAWGVVAVYAAIRLLADEISTLPLDTFRRTTDSTRVPIATPVLLKNPATVGDLQGWLYQLVTSLAGWGNAYGLIVSRDQHGYATGVEWLDPSIVSVDESRPTQPTYYLNGRPTGAEHLIHIRWVLKPGHVVGQSPIDVLRDTVTVASAAMDFKAKFFSNGGTPTGIFKNTGKELTAEQAAVMKSRFTASIRDQRPIVFGSDWSYEASTGMPSETAEWAQTVRLTSTQVAITYGLPASKLAGDPGGTLSYNNLQADTLNFAKSLRPWLTIIENAISRHLPGNAYVKFNSNALVSTDLMTRMQAMQMRRQNGFSNTDEERALEDLPPLPNGEGQSYAPPKSTPVPVAPEPPKETDDAA